MKKQNVKKSEIKNNPAVCKFFKILESNKIGHCHWKSIDKLEAALTGGTDIDILISKKDYSKFNELIHKLGAKKVMPRSWMIYPSMEDFLWWDNKGKSFIHFHVHYKLIIGIKNAKEYVLPLDNLYLSTCIKDKEFDTYIVKPELDLIMLIIRISIKYSTLRLFYLNLRKKQPSEIKELKWLFSLIDKKNLSDTAKKVDSILKLDFSLANFFKTFNLNKKNISTRDLRKIKKALTFYKRTSNFSVRLFRFFRKHLNLFAAFGRNNGKHPLTNGISIAFVGCDGSGKTTIANEVVKTLRWKLSAKKFYLGYNSRSYSFLTRIIVFISYFFRIFKFINTKFGTKINIFGQLIAEYGGLRDRLKLFKQSQKDKGNNMIVIYERFPLKDTIDYPACFFNDCLKTIKTSPFLLKIHAWMTKKYEKILEPDLTFFINTPVDTILARRPMNDKTLKKVEKKYGLVSKYCNNRPNIIQINGKKSIQAIVDEALLNIWNNL